MRADLRQTRYLPVVDRAGQPGFALAVSVPLVCYLWTLGGTSYWLDAGEFNAAAVALGVPHPPGHPLTALLGKLLSLVPLGSLGTRVAFGQALCAALGAGFLYLAVRRSLTLVGRGDGLGESAVALGVSWAVALCHGYWLQAVRSEVYALQSLLLCVAIERLGACELDRTRGQASALAGAGQASALAGAGLALGLGLANNHLMAVVALPAVLPVVWGAVAARGPRVLAGALAAGLLGLSAYVYLPLRSLAGAPIDLGSPHTLHNFLWVVGARVYAREMGQGGSEPLDERFADALILLHENLHGAVVLAALGGAYMLLRTPGTRRFGTVLVLWGLGAFVARPFVGPVRANPDVLGYLIPAFACCAWAAGALVHRLLGMVTALVTLRVVRKALWVAVPLAALAQGPRARGQADLSLFHATQAFDEARLLVLPPRALLVTSLPQSVFRAWELAVVQRARPDVSVLPLPFLRYPGAHAQLARRTPELAGLAQGYLQSGKLEPRTLDALARQRPVFVEIDTHLPTYLGARLLPEGVLHRWQSAPYTEAQAALAIMQRRIRLAGLRRRVAADLTDQETARQLLGIHYADAIYYALGGRRDEALDALASARTLYPRDQLLLELGTALEQSAPGQPLDVQPYLVAPP